MPFKNAEYVFGVYLDFSKTMDHIILLQKFFLAIVYVVVPLFVLQVMG